LLLRHAPSGGDIDISLASLPFELETIAAAEQIDIGGVRVPVARAEDLIIYKAVAFRPQDQQDIERLLTLHSKHIDLPRLRRVIDEFAQAMEEPERVKQFDRIVRAVLES
jgi:predicted nucleotidyltransferase